METYSFKDYFVCPECNSVLNMNDNLFMSYFNSVKLTCPQCKKSIDLWKIFMKQLDPPVISFASHYSLLGCVNNRTKILIKPNELFKLDLSNEIGEGELLYINYTPCSGETFPIETHSNVPISHLKVKNKLIYGQPINENSKETEVNVYYWFAPEKLKDDLSNMLLLDAFKFFFEGDYRYMIISAHSSVEIILSKFIKKILTEHSISEKNSKEFTKSIGTKYQLDTLLPLICNLLNFPILDTKIVGGLKDLRADRNRLIHTGETDILDKTKLKKELISAFFAFRYFKLLNEIIFI